MVIFFFFHKRISVVSKKMSVFFKKFQIFFSFRFLSQMFIFWEKKNIVHQMVKNFCGQSYCFHFHWNVEKKRNNFFVNKQKKKLFFLFKKIFQKYYFFVLWKFFISKILLKMKKILLNTWILANDVRIDFLFLFKKKTYFWQK